MMPHTMSVVEYQELGKMYYKRKEYQKALDAFTDGLDAGVNPDLTLMDYRAATLEKLGNLPAALKEGQKMVRTEKKSIKGYLRSGFILEKMDKPETARKLYEYGLRSVPVCDKDFELLRKVHDKLGSQLAPAKAEDPFVRLPVELVEMVVHYLTFKNMVNCIRVSRQWKQFLTSRPGLWTNLDLSHAKQKVKNSFVRDCIKYSHGKIKNATLHRLYDLSMLRSLSAVCKELESIEVLSTTGNIGQSLLDASQCGKNLRTIKISEQIFISLDCVTQVLRFRPTLESAEFWSIDTRTSRHATWLTDLPSLRKVVFKATKSRDYKSSLNVLEIADLVTRAPNLQDLTLAHWTSLIYVTAMDLSSLKHLKHVRFSSVFMDVLPILPPSIETLYLIEASTRPGHPQIQASRDTALRTNLPNLRDVEFCGGSGLAVGEQIFEIQHLLEPGENGSESPSSQSMSPPSSLHRLSLGLNPMADRAALTSILHNPRISSLRELAITGAPLDDQMAQHLHTFCPDLIRLDISSTRVTGVSVKTLVENLGKRSLAWLGLDHCMWLSSDAVEWARQRGITVSYRMFAEGNGKGAGKRVVERW